MVFQGIINIQHIVFKGIILTLESILIKSNIYLRKKGRNFSILPVGSQLF